MFVIDILDFGQISLVQGLISKEKGKIVVKFLLPRFKDNVISFLKIDRKLITFQPNIKIARSSFSMVCNFTF